MFFGVKRLIDGCSRPLTLSSRPVPPSADGHIQPGLAAFRTDTHISEPPHHFVHNFVHKSPPVCHLQDELIVDRRAGGIRTHVDFVQPVQTSLHTGPLCPGPVPHGFGALSGTALLSNLLLAVRLMPFLNRTRLPGTAVAGQGGRGQNPQVFQILT